MKLPDTSLAIEALDTVSAALPPEVFNHSIRIYLLGNAYAQKKGVKFDEEELFLAGLFHDVGLCDGYKNSSRPFQVNSSNALKEFLGGYRLPPERIFAMADAIDFHMQLFPKWSKGNAAALLQIGAWMDITRLRRWTIKDQVSAIEAEYPRLRIDARFPRMVLSSIGSVHSCLGLLFPRGIAG